MRRSSFLVLLSVLVLPLWSTAALTSGAAKKKTKPAASKASAAAAPGKKSATKTRLVRTKSGKLTRVAVRTAPAPSFQTHPNPERYIEIQKALTDRGYFHGEANGEWGDDSTDALRRFQAGSNLPDDGKINALTLTSLGLGPRHDGATASTVPMPAAITVPSVTESTVGAAASSPTGGAPPPASPSSPPPPLSFF